MDNSHVDILADLVGFETITPHGAAAIDYCADFLTRLGFSCKKLCFKDVSNLYAKLGNYDKNICFAGHVDVVPPLDGWSTPPFKLTEKDGVYYGRGVNDMKGPIAACLAAIRDFLDTNTPNFSISIMLTSDEEIMGDNGTKKAIETLINAGEKITACILCESCAPATKAGEYLKIGCRGSLNVDLVSNGPQCHVVSGRDFGNHLTKFISFLSGFLNTPLDAGSENFRPSSIELTSIDVGNKVRNIIPGSVTAKLNVRFNDLWTFESLEEHISRSLPQGIVSAFERFGFPFIGSDAKFIDFISNTIERTLGTTPEVGTAGGNSDALFIRKMTDVIELGSSISEAHIVDEYISASDLIKLRKVYLEILRYFPTY